MRALKADHAALVSSHAELEAEHARCGPTTTDLRVSLSAATADAKRHQQNLRTLEQRLREREAAVSESEINCTVDISPFIQTFS